MVFIMQRYASALLAFVMCPSVCPYVHPSLAGIVSKLLNAESHKQCYHTWQPRNSFSDAEGLGKIWMGSTPTWAPYAGGI